MGSRKQSEKQMETILTKEEDVTPFDMNGMGDEEEVKFDSQ